jgi:hypothetical protein
MSLPVMLNRVRWCGGKGSGPRETEDLLNMNLQNVVTARERRGRACDMESVALWSRREVESTLSPKHPHSLSKLALLPARRHSGFGLLLLQRCLISGKAAVHPNTGSPRQVRPWQTLLPRDPTRGSFRSKPQQVPAPIRPGHLRVSPEAGSSRGSFAMLGHAEDRHPSAITRLSHQTWPSLMVRKRRLFAAQGSL